MDADHLKVSGGPEEPLNVARRGERGIRDACVEPASRLVMQDKPWTGRIAEAMRDGHIPFTHPAFRARENRVKSSPARV